jgi:hypothetical protein
MSPHTVTGTFTAGTFCSEDSISLAYSSLSYLLEKLLKFRYRQALAILQLLDVPVVVLHKLIP